MKSLVYASPVDFDEALVARIAVGAGDIREMPVVFAIMNEQSTESTSHTGSSLEEFVVVDDDYVCTSTIMADKDILESVQSSKNVIDADYDDENETNNAAPDLTIKKNVIRYRRTLQ
ncbi:hypothetical protein TNCV_1670021 [Trichonephila clavipes]|nr:hypothetical protein TNCV_1670021 [Trichonephila clavipes]